jgi:hypothetical protein
MQPCGCITLTPPFYAFITLHADSAIRGPGVRPPPLTGFRHQLKNRFLTMGPAGRAFPGTTRDTRFGDVPGGSTNQRTSPLRPTCPEPIRHPHHPEGDGLLPGPSGERTENHTNHTRNCVPINHTSEMKEDGGPHHRHGAVPPSPLRSIFCIIVHPGTFCRFSCLEAENGVLSPATGSPFTVDGIISCHRQWTPVTG